MLWSDLELIWLMRCVRSSRWCYVFPLRCSYLMELALFFSNDILRCTFSKFDELVYGFCAYLNSEDLHKIDPLNFCFTNIFFKHDKMPLTPKLGKPIRKIGSVEMERQCLVGFSTFQWFNYHTVSPCSDCIAFNNRVKDKGIWGQVSCGIWQIWLCGGKNRLLFKIVCKRSMFKSRRYNANIVKIFSCYFV